jgi:hypothetical protein
MRLVREVLSEAIWGTLKELGWANLYVFGVLPLPIIMAAYLATRNPIGIVVTGISAVVMLFTAVCMGRVIEIKLTERRLAPLTERLKGLAEDMREMTSPDGDGTIDSPLSEPTIDFQYLQLIDDVSAMYAPRFTALEAQLTEVMHAVENINQHRRSNKGITEKRKRRAYIFRDIKGNNPHFSYGQVAARANLDYGNELDKEVEEHDVRNDYRDMGWEWRPGERLR